MKKMILVIAVSLMAVLCSGCSDENPTNPNGGNQPGQNEELTYPEYARIYRDEIVENAKDVTYEQLARLLFDK